MYLQLYTDIYICIFWYVVISIVCCMHFIAAVLKTDLVALGGGGGGAVIHRLFWTKALRETGRQRDRESRLSGGMNNRNIVLQMWLQAVKRMFQEVQMVVSIVTLDLMVGKEVWGSAVVAELVSAHPSPSDVQVWGGLVHVALSVQAVWLDVFVHCA